MDWGLRPALAGGEASPGAGPRSSAEQSFFLCLHDEVSIYEPKFYNLAIAALIRHFMNLEPKKGFLGFG